MSTTDRSARGSAHPTVAAVGLVTPAAALGPVSLHGRPLRAHAGEALRGAGVEVLPEAVSLRSVRDRGLPLVLHDPACPLTPPGFIADLVGRVSASVLVGVRPVTDTIKVLDGSWVRQTVERDRLSAVTAPVVLPVSVVGALEEWPDLSDLPALVELVRGRWEVELVEAPSIGRRVHSEADVLVLEAFEETRTVLGR